MAKTRDVPADGSTPEGDASSSDETFFELDEPTQTAAEGLSHARARCRTTDGPELDLPLTGQLDASKGQAPKDLERRPYDLYQARRPQIREGKKGWGAAGELDLDRIRSLGE